MDRRTFLKLSGSTVFFAWGCEAETDPLSSDPDPVDGGTLYPDARARDAGIEIPLDAGFVDAEAIDAGAAFVIREAFNVHLNDTTCSHHSHGCSVRPAMYLEDTEVHFLGGSHEVVFWASELVRLQNSELVPFATVGAGPGHGHCGMAWRTSVGPEDRTRMDVCATRGTAMCEG